MEYIINIKETCGKNVVTRDDGKKVYDLLISQWNSNEKIKIDFGNILIASVSFFDEIFGQLALTYSQQELTTKIQVTNIQDFDRSLLNDITRSRLMQKELKKISSL